MGTADRSLALALAVALVLVACESRPATPPPVSTSPVPTPVASPAGDQGTNPGGRPILVDTDLGADDLTALAVLLRDPTVDIRAITVPRTGLVHCNPGLQTLRGLLADFGAVEVPLGCGHAGSGPEAYPFPETWREMADTAYGVTFGTPPASSPGGDAAAVIAQAVAASPAPPLIVALGPWTNLAEALAVDPGLAGRITGIHAMGGTLDAPGNVWADDTPLAIPAEFNFAADPAAVASVLATDVPVTLVPLDATDDVPVSATYVAALEAGHEAAGANLVFEMLSKTPQLSEAGQFLWDQTAAVALVDPTVATWSEAMVRTIVDRPNAGQLVRDPAGRPIRYATSADPAHVEAGVLAGLRRGGPRANPFDIAGEMSVTWDGAACVATSTPTAPGVYLVRLVNDTDEYVVVLIAGPAPPKEWRDLLALVEQFEDPPESGVETPEWVLPVGQAMASPRSRGAGTAEIPAGTFGPFCGVSLEDGVSITPGEPFTIPVP